MRFSVGDRVRVKYSFAGLKMLGYEGFVIFYNNGRVGVEFDDMVPEGLGHSCNGRGKHLHCRWGAFSDLEIITDDAEIITEESEELKKFISGFNIL